VDGRSSGLRPAIRTSPTGRIPQWVLDEAAGRRPPTESWRSWSPPESLTRRRRRRRLRAVGAALAVPAVIVVSLGAAALVRPEGLLSWPTAEELAFPHPTPGREAADEPLGAPLPAPAGGGTPLFVAEQPDSDEPVAYDPCRPIHYVMRPDNAPAGGEAIVHQAVDRVASVTGLQFVYDGSTDEQPSRDREPYQPDRYGDRWAPVVIAWQTDEENTSFLTDVAGEAGSQRVSVGDGPEVFVTGSVALDENAFAQMLARPGGAAVARAVILHELGHLVGLDHAPDPAQLMYPTTSAVLDFAPGDLTGLVALGQGACVPAL